MRFCARAGDTGLQQEVQPGGGWRVMKAWFLRVCKICLERNIVKTIKNIDVLLLLFLPLILPLFLLFA